MPCSIALRYICITLKFRRKQAQHHLVQRINYEYDQTNKCLMVKWIHYFPRSPSSPNVIHSPTFSSPNFHSLVILINKTQLQCNTKLHRNAVEEGIHWFRILSLITIQERFHFRRSRNKNQSSLEERNPKLHQQHGPKCTPAFISPSFVAVCGAVTSCHFH